MLNTLTSYLQRKKTKVSNLKNLWLFYFFGSLFFLCIRSISIQSIPSVISHDEIYYPAEARALAVSGHDPTGTWSPWSLTSAHSLYAELPGLVMTPAAIIFDDPLVAARATHIFIGTLFCLVLAAFSYQITKNHTISFFAFLLAGVNPWLFQFSRMGFDALFSLFFLLSGVTLYLGTSHLKKLWSIPFLFVGFFQYQGLKVVFIPLVFGTVIFDLVKQKTYISQMFQIIHKKETRNRFVPAIIVLLFSIILFGTYLVRLSTQNAGERTSDLIFSDVTYTEAHVNTHRQQSFESPVVPFFTNKATVIFDRFVSQYFESFSWHHLFITGEPLRNPFSVWKHGMFYLLDCVLIIFGFFYLYSNRKSQTSGIFLTFLLLLAPLAGALSAKGSWIMFRSSLLVPVFITVGACGLWWIKEKTSKLFFAVLIFIYLFFVARFFFMYFYSYPIIGTQGEYFSERIIANYIIRNPDKNILVYASEPRFMFEAILVYTNAITKESIKDVQAAYTNEAYSFANFTVLNKCYDQNLGQNTTAFVHQSTQPCDSQDDYTTEHVIAIPSLLDSGAIYRVHNDTFCSNFSLQRFSHITENRFFVENLSKNDFCTTFFIKN